MNAEIPITPSATEGAGSAPGKTKGRVGSASRGDRAGKASGSAGKASGSNAAASTPKAGSVAAASKGAASSTGQAETPSSEKEGTSERKAGRKNVRVRTGIGLRPPHGSRQKKRILGRGVGSGRGRTSTRGHKGHRARSGFKAMAFFEGGQNPLVRRLPKFGFSNSPFKKTYTPVSLTLLEERFESGEVITVDALKKKRIVKGQRVLVKITNRDKLAAVKKSFKVHLDGLRVTASARERLAAVGSEFIEKTDSKSSQTKS